MYNLYFIFIFNFFSTNNTFANDRYLKCLEKITEVRIGSSPEYVAGKEHGYSFVKLNLKSNNPIATIHLNLTLQKTSANIRK